MVSENIHNNETNCRYFIIPSYFYLDLSETRSEIISGKS